MPTQELPHPSSTARWATPVEELRAAYRRRSDCRFVTSDEYVRLLVGERKLERLDARAARLKGLHDPLTGTTYLVEEEALCRTRAG